MSVSIIDVSNNNGNDINWTSVAQAGFVGGIVKTSEGSTFRDYTLPRNWSEMKKNKLLRGAYHFSYPSLNSVQSEVNLYLSQIGHSFEEGDLPVLDIETGNGDLSQWALAWLKAVEKSVGIRPWIYTGGWFAPGRLTDPELGTYHLWDSSYTSYVPRPYAPWEDITLWQYTETGSVPGVSGHCDISLFNGTKDDYLTLVTGKKVPVTPTPLPEKEGPTAHAYVVSTATALRVAPDKNAPHLGDALAVGTHLSAVSGWTTHWRKVRTGATPTIPSYIGWAKAANLKAAE